MTKVPARRRGKKLEILREKRWSAIKEARACREEYADIRNAYITARYRLVARAFVATQRMLKDPKSWKKFCKESFFAERKHKPEFGKPEHLLLHMLEHMIDANSGPALKRASRWALTMEHVPRTYTAEAIFKLLKKHKFKNLRAALKPERLDSRSKLANAKASTHNARTTTREKPKTASEPPHTLRLSEKARAVAGKLKKDAEVTMRGVFKGVDEEGRFRFTVTRIKRRA
jgi:hypothetical protein